MVAAASREMDHVGEHVGKHVAREAQRTRIRELVAAYHGAIWKFVRHLGVSEALADEVVQEVFLVAFRREGDLREGSERAFLYGTAFRTAKHALKKHHREPAVEDVDRSADLAPNPEETLDRKQTRELAYRLLAELDDDLRAPFVMFELEGMSMQEIGTVMGLPIPTVGSRLRRAREAFRTCVHRYKSRLRGAL